MFWIYISCLFTSHRHTTCYSHFIFTRGKKNLKSYARHLEQIHFQAQSSLTHLTLDNCAAFRNDDILQLQLLSLVEKFGTECCRLSCSVTVCLSVLASVWSRLIVDQWKANISAHVLASKVKLEMKFEREQ